MADRQESQAEQSSEMSRLRLALAKAEGELRAYQHHDKRATDVLDAAGVRKFDDLGDPDDSTDDRCGMVERALWCRIEDLARDAKAMDEVRRIAQERSS